MVFNDISAAQATERRLSLYDEIEDEKSPARRLRQWSSRRRRRAAAPRSGNAARADDAGHLRGRRQDLAAQAQPRSRRRLLALTNSQLQLNREFSYPSIKQTPDGQLNIAYTFHRQRIKYVRVAEDWVRG